MKYAYRKIVALTLAGTMIFSLLTACSNNTVQQDTAQQSQQTEQIQQTDSDVLMIIEQGMFSSGGKVITAEGTLTQKIIGKKQEQVKQHTLTMQMYYIKFRKMKQVYLWYFCTAMVSLVWDG